MHIYGVFGNAKVAGNLTYAHKMMADPSLRHITYFSKTKRGESYKSVVCAIEGAHQNIIGLLCVNFYLTAPPVRSEK